MSRRHTTRTLEHPPAQADPVDRVVEHFADAGVPVWYATKMPYPWESYWWYQWQHAWAEYTLTVAEAAWRNQGARLYATHKDAELRADLQDWLTVRAVEAGARYTPNPWHPAPERSYGAWLSAVLKSDARYHFAQVVGHESTGPKSGAAVEGYRRTGPSIEAQAEQEAQGGARYAHHSLWAVPFEAGDPASVIIRLEDLEERVAEIERDNVGTGFFSHAPKTATCLQNLCDRPVMARGLCQTHYAFERNRAVERGDWAPYQAPQGCEVDGCDEPFYARNRCVEHYRQARPACTEDGCDKPQNGQGLCTTHYARVQAAQAPRCSVEGCTTRARVQGMCVRHHNQATRPDTTTPCTSEGCTRDATTRGLCDAHYNRWRRAQQGPCALPDCDARAFAKGLCGPHYKAERKGKIQR